jgi:tetratricopeptide (TPR) repeat protein
LLRQATGYIELAEFGMTTENSVSEPANKLLRNAIKRLDQLSSKHDSGNAVILRAEALRTLCHFSDALPYYQRVVRENPHSMAGWLGFGWCLKRLGQLAEAIDALTDGLNYCENEPALAYNLSCYHSLAGNIQAAIKYLNKAIASDDRFRSLTSCERDFDSIRNDPRFVAVVDQPV